LGGKGHKTAEPAPIGAYGSGDDAEGLSRALRRSGRPTLSRLGTGGPSRATVTPLLPELDVARARRYCEQKVPAHARHQVRVEVEVEPRTLTIVERRAPWREDYGPEWSRSPIARLRWVQRTGVWTLHWRDRHARWHRYDRVGPSARIDVLLDELDRDPTCIFWG